MLGFVNILKQYVEDADLFFTNLKAPPPKLILINSFSDKKPFFGKSSSESSSAAALRQYLPYSAAAAAVSACSPGSSSATSTASHQSPKHFETSDHSVRKRNHSLLTMFHISRKTFTFAEVHSSWWQVRTHQVGAWSDFIVALFIPLPQVLQHWS